MRGFLTGALALALLSVVVRPEAAQRVGTIPAAAGRVARWWLSPAVPLIAPRGQSAEPVAVLVATTTPYPSPAQPGPVRTA